MQNTILIIFLLLAAISSVFIINKYSNSVKTEKYIKLILFLAGSCYVSFDLFIKEKFALLSALIIGSLIFIYILYYAKKS